MHEYTYIYSSLRNQLTKGLYDYKENTFSRGVFLTLLMN